MSGPTSGVYRIQNYRSRWSVTTKTDDGIAQPGDPIKTAKGAERTFPDESRLTVSIINGNQYTFQNIKTKMFIGSGEDESGNAAAAWSTTPQSWDVSSVGPGMWLVSMPGAADSFWFDSVVGENPWTEV
ncbi:hypothetical protein CVT24_003322 [Panaeolus cyanescens]|uniref:Uncharacterized protein n=1 Tax=Panaeolus cyanescens TaxID=181874 RepID=A0A409WTD3_9AGAR|nr:hypothetical protein CVT24_003322 [Panaeolus cyanescens]